MLAGFAAALAMSVQSPDISIIPKPVSIQARPGEFTVDSRTTISGENEIGDLAHFIQRSLAPATGFYFPTVRSSRGNTIELRLDKRLRNLGSEGYRLEISPSRILIRANAQAGLFYGFETLRQMLPPDIFRGSNLWATKPGVAGKRLWALPCATIEDSPRFSWRGAHMDVSRHFMPKEFVLKFLDLMALHKLNVFHWHLVDDNGWRIEIKRYPRLTEVGSATDFSSMNPTNATRSINQKAGGFYTQDDIREIVQYAADRFISVVAEIELPGHSNAAILAYPELGNRQQIADAGKDTKFLGAYDNVYNVEDSTVQFLKNVLDEVMDLFPSRFIHIGGDEVWKEPWKQNPKAQDRVKQLGLKSEEELQSWFIKQFDDYLSAKGRRLIGWDEILEGGLAANAAVMSWRGIGGGIAAARAGHDVVMTPTSHAYFDYYQSRLQSNEPKGIGGFLPIETVYQFEPVPSELTPQEARHVLGGQANLWAEFIPHPKHMEYMAYPRLCATAEVVWSPKDSRNWEDFRARLSKHLERLDVLDVNYRPLSKDPKPAAQWKAGETAEQFAVKEWDVSKAVPVSGDYEVVFSYTWGENRLDIQWIEFAIDGNTVQRVEHAGQTGAASRDNVYRVHLEGVKPGSKITLRASVRSDGGNKSNGDIYIQPSLPKARVVDKPS